MYVVSARYLNLVRLCLAFLGEHDPNFHWENSGSDNQVYKYNTKKCSTVLDIMVSVEFYKLLFFQLISLQQMLFCACPFCMAGSISWMKVPSLCSSPRWRTRQRRVWCLTTSDAILPTVTTSPLCFDNWRKRRWRWGSRIQETFFLVLCWGVNLFSDNVSRPRSKVLSLVDGS